MILLVDIGNSRLKWACLEGDKLLHHGSCLHQTGTCKTIVWDELPMPDAVYCASVAGDEVNHWFARQVDQCWGLPVQMLQSTARCAGLTNGYRQPKNLGIDRWAALIGARQISSGPFFVVDCGSAVTVDAVDSEGRHLGGFIVPGLRMQREMLLRQTAGIRDSDARLEQHDWGLDTTECMSLGSLETVAGLIERSRRKLMTQQGKTVTVFVTGGDASAVVPLLDFSPHYEEHLVLLGMARIVREHGEQ